MLEDLEERLLEYKIAGEFLANISKEFGEGDKKLMKAMELRKLEQGEKMIEEFVQEFRRATSVIRQKCGQTLIRLGLVIISKLYKR